MAIAQLKSQIPINLLMIMNVIFSFQEVQPARRFAMRILLFNAVPAKQNIYV